VNANDILKAIADVGFPVVVSVYLLMVFGNKLDKLTDAVNNLTKFIEGLSKRE
jgi:hypothetical protein